MPDHVGGISFFDGDCCDTRLPEKAIRKRAGVLRNVNQLTPKKLRILKPVGSGIVII